jgi:tetratricopeptide (TPR) repeat protein
VIEILLQAERTLAIGRLDEAERLYRQAADADPRNSIAVVGLARVALERGDDPGAYRFARRALAIDPENVAAQRLAQRLEEVYAYRGESIAALAGETEPSRGEPEATGARPDAAANGAAPTRAAPTGASPAPGAEPKAPAAPSAPPATAPTTDNRRSLVDRLLRRSRS